MPSQRNHAQPLTDSHPDAPHPDSAAGVAVHHAGAITNRRVIPVGDARTIVVRPRIPGWYKALLALSLALNALILVLLFTFGAGAYRFYRALSAEVSSLAQASPAGQRLASLGSDPKAAAAYTVDTASHTVDEALAAVKQVEGATIRGSVPIDQQLPLQAQATVDANTVVTTNAPVPLVVPARITFPGGGGNLNATVALNLPTGLQLPIHIGLSVPVTGTVPAKFDVPISIAVKDTELAGPFARLQRLLEPAAEFFSAGRR